MELGIRRIAKLEGINVSPTPSVRHLTKPRLFRAPVKVAADDGDEPNAEGERLDRDDHDAVPPSGLGLAPRQPQVGREPGTLNEF